MSTTASEAIAMRMTSETIESAPQATKAPRGVARRLCGLGALGVLGAAAVFAWAERPATAEMPPPDYFMITNAVSNLCLGMAGNNTRRYFDSDYDPVATQISTEVNYCNPGNGDCGEDNQWELEPTSDGYVRIKNRKGLCLTLLRNVDPELGTISAMMDNCYVPLGSWKSRQWRIVAEADGFKRIINRRNGYCLNVVGTDKHVAGYRVQVNPCLPDGKDATRDARWRF